MADPLPWERRPGESEVAYAAFCEYRDAGPGRRSITAVARGLNKSRALIGRWSSRWAWQARCREHDADR